MKLKYLLVLLPLLLVSCKEEQIPIPYEVHKVTKSRTVIDCKGKDFNEGKATEIRISSSIKDVTVKNCNLKGSIRVLGLGMHGEDEKVKESSYKAGHTERAQAAAPSNVLLSNLTIEEYKEFRCILLRELQELQLKILNLLETLYQL